MTRELKKYYRTVRKKLFMFPRKKRNAIFEELQRDVSAYLEENPKATIQEVKDVFGTPAGIAESSLTSCSAENLEKQVRLRRRMLILILAVIAAFLLAVLILQTIFIIDHHIFVHSHAEVVVSPAMSGTYEGDPSAIATY